MKKCFLCGSEDSIIDFNNESFKNCYLKLLFRREKKFLYGEVRLSLDSIDNVGYHFTCYKKVTVLSKKYNDELRQFCMQQDAPCGVSSVELNFDSSLMTPDRTAPSESVISGGGPSSRLEPGADAASAEASSSRRSSTTTNVEVLCLFCNCTRKKIGQRRVNVIFSKSDATVITLKKIASLLDDSEVLDKLENQIVAYHATCFSSYQVRMKRQTEEHANSKWHKDREIHKLAFNSLATFIEQEIINNHKVMYASQLFFRYKALWLEFAEDKNCLKDFSFYRSEYLEKKITKVFGNLLTIESFTGSHNKKIIYPNDKDISTLANKVVELEEAENTRFQGVAYSLRH